MFCLVEPFLHYVLEYRVANLVTVDMVMPNDKARIVFCQSRLLELQGVVGSEYGAAVTGMMYINRLIFLSSNTAAIHWPSWSPVFIGKISPCPFER